jgi:hypothetical protein
MGDISQHPAADSRSHITDHERSMELQDIIEPDHDLERYLRMVVEPELTTLEEHLLGCPACAERAEQSAAWVDAIRAASAKPDLKR